MEHLAQLNALSPAVFYGLLLVWVLREVLGAIVKVLEKRAQSDELGVVLEAFNKVAENIENQTEIIREFAYELKTVHKRVESLEVVVDKMRRQL